MYYIIFYYISSLVIDKSLQIILGTLIDISFIPVASLL